jgi:hypothetical protein
VTVFRPSVPTRLEDLVHRLLEKDPAKRCQDADALRAELDALRAAVTPASTAQPAP